MPKMTKGKKISGGRGGGGGGKMKIAGSSSISVEQDGESRSVTGWKSNMFQFDFEGKSAATSKKSDSLRQMPAFLVSTKVESSMDNRASWKEGYQIDI